MGTVRSGSAQVRPVRLRFRGELKALLRTALLATSVAGCSFNTQHPVTPKVDPNLYPQNYRKQVAVYLSQELSDRANFRGARISQAVLKQVGDSQHYVVCLQFNGHSQLKGKVAIYLSGDITQFIDSTPE